MITINNAENCCGCTACASICNHNAITMQPDVLGFLYPKVDFSKCVNCGLCDKVCSFNEKYDKTLNLSTPDVYGARHKNIKEVETSRSGAAFIAFSDYILEQGGVVYGAGYTEHFRVIHKRATNKNERNEFKGSKYVQSDLGDTFSKVKKDLKEGLLVLFSGTPCQTSGLNSFIGHNLRKKLFLIDIVCHGVPSPYVWRDYLEQIEKIQGDRIYSVDFRNKTLFGWKAHKETFTFETNKNKPISFPKFTFGEIFCKHVMFRQSCGNCHFCNTTRPSDVTIADYWGWENTNPKFNEDNKGVSLILINTNNGRDIFNKVSEKLNFFHAKLQDSLQPNLQHPSFISKERIKFEQDFINKGVVFCFKRYGNRYWKNRLKHIVKRITRKIHQHICKV